jgi:hypothetical protein
MKKKVLMSEEALRAMLGTTPPDTVDTEAADLPNKPIEPDEGEEASTEAAETQEAQIGVTELAALATEFEEYKVAAASELEATKAELAELASAHAEELAKVQAGADGLKEIVCDNISSMRIALGFAAVDLSDFTPEAVATEFTSIKGKFMKFPVGSVVPAPDKEDVQEEGLSSLDMSGFRALGFKSK